MAINQIYNKNILNKHHLFYLGVPIESLKMILSFL